MDRPVLRLKRKLSPDDLDHQDYSGLVQEKLAGWFPPNELYDLDTDAKANLFHFMIWLKNNYDVDTLIGQRQKAY